MQCQAKAKSTGVQCRRRAVKGKRVCTVHGGLTPSGVASKNFKHGRYSKALPGRLMERYQAAMADDEYLALREEIAVTEARMADVISTVDSGESGKIWRELEGLRKRFQAAQRKKDAEDIAETIALTYSTIGRGSHDSAAWAEVGQLMDQRRRLADSERKRLESMQQIVTAEQAMALVATLAASVRRHVLEYMGDTPEAWGLLAAVQTDITGAISRDAGKQVDVP